MEVKIVLALLIGLNLAQGRKFDEKFCQISFYSSHHPKAERLLYLLPEKTRTMIRKRVKSFQVASNKESSCCWIIWKRIDGKIKGMKINKTPKDKSRFDQQIQIKQPFFIKNC